MIKKITVWEKLVLNKKKNSSLYKYNHIKDGWSDKDYPTPMFESQKNWLKGKWRKKHTYLKDNKVTC